MKNDYKDYFESLDILPTKVGTKEIIFILPATRYEKFLKNEMAGGFLCIDRGVDSYTYKIDGNEETSEDKVAVYLADKLVKKIKKGDKITILGF
jgi:hypothetical protein